MLLTVAACILFQTLQAKTQGTACTDAQVTTLRERLIKLAALGLTVGNGTGSPAKMLQNAATLVEESISSVDIPRADGPHGVRRVRLPWAEVRARFTALFERLAIDVLKETDIRDATRSCGSAGTRPGTSWSGPSSAASAPSTRA